MFIQNGLIGSFIFYNWIFMLNKIFFNKFEKRKKYVIMSTDLIQN